MSDNPIVPEVPNWSDVPPQGPPQVPPPGPAQQYPPQQYPPEQFGQQQYGQQQYQPQQYGQPYPPQQWAPPAGGGYQQYGYAPGANAVLNPFESRGTTILVLGIVSLVMCGLLGPVAFFMGRSLKNEAESAGWPEPGNAKAGRICGLVATCLVGLGILFYVVMFIFIGVASTGSSY